MKKSKILAVMTTLTLLSATSFAEDKKKSMPMTPEQRQSMATAHDKMAKRNERKNQREDSRDRRKTLNLSFHQLLINLIKNLFSLEEGHS